MKYASFFIPAITDTKLPLNFLNPLLKLSLRSVASSSSRILLSSRYLLFKRDGLRTFFAITLRIVILALCLHVHERKEKDYFERCNSVARNDTVQNAEWSPSLAKSQQQLPFMASRHVRPQIGLFHLRIRIGKQSALLFLTLSAARIRWHNLNIDRRPDLK